MWQVRSGRVAESRDRRPSCELGQIASSGGGLIEVHDPKGKMFGFPRLRELVAEHGEERSLGDLLLEELFSFVGERAGSRRTTSPSLPYDALQPQAELLRKHLFFYKIG